MIAILLQGTAAPVVHKSAEEFVKLDPYGVGMTIISMGVVFSALILLYLIFRTIGKAMTGDFKRSSLIKQGKHEEAAQVPGDIQGEVTAAIGLALSLYSSQMHDVENTVLTIKKVSRNYSPWSSKIYGLRQLPR